MITRGPGAALPGVQALALLSPFEPTRQVLLSPVLRRKLRHREDQLFSQSHTATKGQLDSSIHCSAKKEKNGGVEQVGSHLQKPKTKQVHRLTDIDFCVCTCTHRHSQGNTGFVYVKSAISNRKYKDGRILSGMSTESPL